MEIIENHEEVVLSESEIDSLFLTEIELSGANIEDIWMGPCGHDCCTCDAECK